MRNIFWAIALLATSFACRLNENPEHTPGSEKDYYLTPLPFNEVVLEDQFWKPRLQTQLETLVPFALDKTQPAVDNLRKTGQFLRGDTTDLPFPHRYISSDLYKVMEGAAYLLTVNQDTSLEQRMDNIIDIIAEAQQEDGYLYVAHITGVSKDHAHWGGGGMGDRPYSFVVHSHELYNMGHLYEAAIAYYRATGKDKLLKVVEKNARHINRVFFEGDPNYNAGVPVNQAPGHQELELALTKLYRLTEEPLYLEMAKKFLDIRGVTYVPDGEKYLSPTYAQQHVPVKEQRQAVGHAVRAAYQYAAMAEVGALTGTKDYQQALDHIWHDLTDKKMHITGGLGAMHGIEGFGPDYELPNKEAYNETCAAVGNVLFNFRMFLSTGKADYLDVAEVALLNNALAGVNLNGDRFFYVNPLEADGATPFNHGTPGRSPWFNTACCPSNIARLIPQVPGMLYTYTEREIYTGFYAGSSTVIPLEKGPVQIQQQTNYPFEGTVSFQLRVPEPHSFALKLRIPGWARSERFVPGDLYYYLDSLTNNSWSVSVNGKPVRAGLENGFAVIDRRWKAGDNVKLQLPMPVRFSKSHPNVEADRGRLAVTRGPLVFCAEAIDQDYPMEELALLAMPKQNEIRTTFFSDGILQGIPRIQFPLGAMANEDSPEKSVQLIPYYAWNNRGDAAMMVWLPIK